MGISNRTVKYSPSFSRYRFTAVYFSPPPLSLSFLLTSYRPRARGGWGGGGGQNFPPSSTLLSLSLFFPISRNLGIVSRGIRGLSGDDVSEEAFFFSFLPVLASWIYFAAGPAGVEHIGAGHWGVQGAA